VLDILQEKRVDGVVLCSSRLPGVRLEDTCARLPAVVLVNRQRPASGNTASVLVDDGCGTRLAVGHLVRSGRRIIGFLAGPGLSNSARERARGFHDGLEEEGLAFDPALS
jgi:LacI family transcriptional regulator